MLFRSIYFLTLAVINRAHDVPVPPDQDPAERDRDQRTARHSPAVIDPFAYPAGGNGQRKRECVAQDVLRRVDPRAQVIGKSGLDRPAAHGGAVHA